MNKRIVFVVNHDLVIYNFRKEIVEALLMEKYEVFIISPPGTRIKILEEMGCYYYPVHINRHGLNPFSDLKFLLNIKKIIKEIDPLVVLTFTIKPNIYGGIVSSYLGIPYLVNITGLGTSMQEKGIVKNIVDRLYRLSMRKVNRIFFQNEHDLNYFENSNISSSEKYALIPGSGVNLNHFSLQEYPNSNSIKFIFISRLMKEKGFDLYLEAAKYIKKRYPETEFHICGFAEQNYSNQIESLIQDNTIIYHGMVMDIRNILKDIHCTVHPTYYPEGISNVLLESAACGKPLITTDRPGCREVVDEGVNGFLILENDLNSLIEALIKFIKLSHLERKQLGLNGRKKVVRQFDRQVVVRKYMEEISKISR